MSEAFRPYLDRVLDGQTLTEEESGAAFDLMSAIWWGAGARRMAGRRSMQRASLWTGRSSMAPRVFARRCFRGQTYLSAR